jgi:protein AroM
MKIGAITIGQSPRVDLVPEFRRALGVDAEIIEKGALDGLSLDQVRTMAPRSGDHTLVTRMRDGTEVKISEKHIDERLKQCVGNLEKEGVELIALFCTGAFPGLTSRKLLLRPDRLLENVVAALLPEGLLAVVLPSADQISVLGRKWARKGLEVVGDSFSPYSSAGEQVELAARRVEEKNPDLVVLDCMGFTEEHCRVFRKITGKPVILPRQVLGRVAGMLLDQ